MTNDKLSLKEETLEESADTDTVFRGKDSIICCFSLYQVFSLLT